MATESSYPIKYNISIPSAQWESDPFVISTPKRPSPRPPKIREAGSRDTGGEKEKDAQMSKRYNYLASNFYCFLDFLFKKESKIN